MMGEPHHENKRTATSSKNLPLPLATFSRSRHPTHRSRNRLPIQGGRPRWPPFRAVTVVDQRASSGPPCPPATGRRRALLPSVLRHGHIRWWLLPRPLPPPGAALRQQWPRGLNTTTIHAERRTAECGQPTDKRVVKTLYCDISNSRRASIVSFFFFCLHVSGSACFALGVCVVVLMWPFCFSQPCLCMLISCYCFVSTCRNGAGERRTSFDRIAPKVQGACDQRDD